MSKFNQNDHDNKDWGESLTDKPNTARIYDYLLGGYHNFEADRAAANAILKVYPHLRLSAQANRAFLRRAVMYMAAKGINQYLDIGSGIPTAGNVHEVAQELLDEPRVVYVDIDPVAVAYSKEILKRTPFVTAITGDVSKPEEIFGHHQTQKLLDFRQPLGVLLVSVVHFILDDRSAYKAVREIRDALAPDSYIALLHATLDDIPDDINLQLQKVIASSDINTSYRTYDEITEFFNGMEMVKPGLVRPPLWRPESPSDVLIDHPERVIGWSGIARVA